MSSDWESIMNGVFGSGGRFTGKSAGPAEPEKAPEKDAAPARPRDTDPLAALQRNADAMNEALRRQAEELAAMGMRSRKAPGGTSRWSSSPPSLPAGVWPAPHR